MLVGRHYSLDVSSQCAYIHNMVYELKSEEIKFVLALKDGGLPSTINIISMGHRVQLAAMFL